MGELAKRQAPPIALPQGAVLHDNGLELPPGLPFDGVEVVRAEAERMGWEAVEGKDDGAVYFVNGEGEIVGRRDPECYKKTVKSLFERVRWLAGETSAVQLQLGDAINFGEAEYGERYAQWVNQTDYVYGSLANIAWVCREVPREMRLEGLTYYHFQQVAPLERDENKLYWLKTALENEWSGRELNDQINRQRITDGGGDPDLYEVERNVGRTVETFKAVSPDKWADVIYDHQIRPLRHLCPQTDYQRFLLALRDKLTSEGETDGSVS